MYDEDGMGMGLTRIRTAPDGGGVRRANKLARMGITPEKDVPSGSVGFGVGIGVNGGGRKREKLRRWVGGLTGRGLLLSGLATCAHMHCTCALFVCLFVNLSCLARPVAPH